MSEYLVALNYYELQHELYSSQKEEEMPYLYGIIIYLNEDYTEVLVRGQILHLTNTKVFMIIKTSEGNKKFTIDTGERTSHKIASES